jgi:hypothetical protein
MFSDAEIAEYNRALVETLRTTDPNRLRAFATTWGQRLGNRGLQQLARATDDVIERRMWMMIRDRPDLAELHAQADAWLTSHPQSQP